MGYWGSFVVCRFAHDFEDVEAIFDRVGPPVEEWAVGGWRFGQFAGQELEGSAKDVLDALVDLTGAPVLMAYIVDSDAAVIDAATPVDDHWRGCLGRRAMRAATAQIGEDFNTRFLSADAAARNAAMRATMQASSAILLPFVSCSPPTPPPTCSSKPTSSGSSPPSDCPVGRGSRMPGSACPAGLTNQHHACAITAGSDRPRRTQYAGPDLRVLC